MIKMKLSECPFQNFKALKFYNFDFQKFCNKSKNKKLERKQKVHFPRRTLITKKKKIKPSISNNQWKPQPKPSMIAKTQNKPKSLLIWMKIVPFETRINLRNTKFLTFNQSLISDQYNTFDPSNQRKEKCQ